MDSEASDLINVRIKNGEAQGCGELLTVLQVSLKEIAERERSYARVGLKTGAHFADAETGQRTVAYSQPAGRVQTNKATLADNRVSGAHADGDDHVAATLGRAYSPQSSRKSEILAGYRKAVGRSRRHHGERCQKHERENQEFTSDSPHGEFVLFGPNEI